MIKVAPLTDKDAEKFKTLFAQYYAELECPDNVDHLLDEYVLCDLLAGLIKIDMLYDGETAAGFVIYQIDEIENDWNFKEGWGDVREIYVIPSSRKQGLGKFLLYTAEMKLRESGADKAYVLPYEKSIPFFKACGYKNSGEYNEDLDCEVYEKSLIAHICDKT